MTESTTDRGTQATPKRRALITCADRYMGRAIAEKFRQIGIEVV